MPIFTSGLGTIGGLGARREKRGDEDSPKEYVKEKGLRCKKEVFFFFLFAKQKCIEEGKESDGIKIRLRRERRRRRRKLFNQPPSERGEEGRQLIKHPTFAFFPPHTTRTFPEEEKKNFSPLLSSFDPFPQTRTQHYANPYHICPGVLTCTWD